MYPKPGKFRPAEPIGLFQGSLILVVLSGLFFFGRWLGGEELQNPMDLFYRTLKISTENFC